MENIPTPGEYQNKPPTQMPTEIPPNTPPNNQPQRAGKQRHGCLTVWLILIILANIGTTVAMVSIISTNPGSYYAWAMPVYIIFGVWAVICAIALFNWKKWGFYGFILGAVGLMIVYLISRSYAYAFTPFISVAVLFAVLNIGGVDKGWTQLE
jgi:hypothetical protein